MTGVITAMQSAPGTSFAYGATVEEVVGAVVFPASPAAASITGQVIVVDGDLTPAQRGG